MYFHNSPPSCKFHMEICTKKKLYTTHVWLKKHLQWWKFISTSTLILSTTATTFNWLDSKRLVVLKIIKVPPRIWKIVITFWTSFRVYRSPTYSIVSESIMQGRKSQHDQPNIVVSLFLYIYFAIYYTFTNHLVFMRS